MDNLTGSADIRVDDLLSALEDAAYLTFESIEAAFEESHRDPGPEATNRFTSIHSGSSAPSEYTSISIGFDGDIRGDIILRSGATLATDLARALLMMEPDEELTQSDVHDSLAEFANIIGGVMKTNVLDPHGEYALGLPEVMTRSTETRGERAGSLLYKQTRGQLLLEVWVRGDDGDDGNANV